MHPGKSGALSVFRFRDKNLAEGLSTVWQLSDLGNLTMPFNFGPAVASTGYLQTGLKGAPPHHVPISLEDLEREYCTGLGLSYPLIEMRYVRSWMVRVLTV